MKKKRVLGLVVAILIFTVITNSIPIRKIDIKVYWKTAQRTFNQQIDPYSRQAGDRLPFVYPPTGLLLMYPFSKLDMEQSVKLILLINLLIVMTILMGLIINDLARDDPSGRLIFWGPIYISLYGGIYQTLTFCQINLIILFVLWMYWRCARASQFSYFSGVALALGSIAKPHYALLIVAAGPIPGRNLIIGASITGIVLLVLSIILTPEGSWHSWINQIVGNASYIRLPEGISSIAAPWNRSIAGFIARFFVPNRFIDPLVNSPMTARIISTVLVVILFAMTALTLFFSMQRINRSPKDRDLELSVISIFVFLASPASWTHHLVMLLPATLIMLRDGVLDSRQRLGSRLTVGLVLAVIALTFDDLLTREVRVASRAIMSLMTVAIVALWVLVVARLRLRTTSNMTNNHAIPRN